MQVKRVVTGMVLAVMAGGSFGHAYLHHRDSWWALGATILLAAAFQVVSAFSAGPPRDEERIPPPSGSADEHALGEALIRLGRITPRQLNSALAQQRRTQQPIKQVLLEMGLVTGQQIEETLSRQRREVFVWRAAGK
ncbi:MAG: hypothetical protein ABSD48_18375 [Armatimonadota bacterium]|jgi:hypothetical protein